MSGKRQRSFWGSRGADPSMTDVRKMSAAEAERKTGPLTNTACTRLRDVPCAPKSEASPCRAWGSRRRQPMGGGTRHPKCLRRPTRVSADRTVGLFVPFLRFVTTRQGLTGPAVASRCDGWSCLEFWASEVPNQRPPKLEELRLDRDRKCLGITPSDFSAREDIVREGESNKS